MIISAYSLILIECFPELLKSFTVETIHCFLILDIDNTIQQVILSISTQNQAWTTNLALGAFHLWGLFCFVFLLEVSLFSISNYSYRDGQKHSPLNCNSLPSNLSSSFENFMINFPNTSNIQ